MAGTVDERSAKLAASSLDALETRDRILVEAMRLFKVYGYSKTTVADIADACRMSPANVYRFFTSKSAINNAICERFIADDEAALVAISQAAAGRRPNASRAWSSSSIAARWKTSSITRRCTRW